MKRRKITSTRDLEQALKDHGFVIIRQRKHRTWQNADGVLTQTSLGNAPHEFRSLRNTLAALRRQGVDLEGR